MPALLERLFVYPVKSARGIAVRAWDVDAFGLRHDRRWMITEPGGRFITQRDEPRLSQLGVSLEDADGGTAQAAAPSPRSGTVLLLSAPGRHPIRVSVPSPDAERVRVRVWGDEVAAARAGDEPDAWLSGFLGRAARLVHMPDDVARPADPDHAPRGTRVAFADALPFLLTTEAALAALNARLEHPIPMSRFRPNLVVSGTAPHAEDGWRRVRIGTIGFAVVKPCARCVVTTVDAETAATGKEPLRTLARYRRHQGKVLFGQNLVHERTGRLEVGMPVEVLERGAPVIPPPGPVPAPGARPAE